MIAPDPRLPWSPESLRVWHKITGNLGERWEPIFRTGAYVTAMACVNYMACCRSFGPGADITRETGALARRWLDEMAYPLTDVVPILCDDLGRDVDILRLVLE